LSLPRPHRSQLAPEVALQVLREEAAGGRLAPRLVDLMHEVVLGSARSAEDNGGGLARHPSGASSHPRLGVVGGTATPLGARGRRQESGPPLG
jgi:hypothetical protein